MKNYLLCLIVLLSWGEVLSQNKYVDSLENYLANNLRMDTDRVLTTHRLSYRLSEINTGRAWKYATETQQVAKQIGFTRGLCLANINFAILESNEGNYRRSADFYLEAIKIAEDINYTRGLSISYNNIADNYLDLKDYQSAIEYSLKALQLNQGIKEQRGQAINLEQLGNIYYQRNHLDVAKKYWDEAYPLAKTANDGGNIYTQVLIDLAKYYVATKDFNKAIEHLHVADSIATSTSELLSRIYAYKGYAGLYSTQGNSNLALSYLHKARAFSLELHNMSEECEILNLLATEFEKRKQYDSGIYYLRKHKVLGDSVLNYKNLAHLAFLQSKHEAEVKDRENKKLKSIQKVQTQAISQKNILLLVTTIALVLAILSLILIYRTQQNKKKHAELEEINRVSQYNQQIAELEVKSLRSQMNPHFLFNSLNSIRNYIIKNEPQIASNYLADFATLMRKILDTSQQNKISLDEEKSMLTLYLNLELMRFSNGFTYSFHVDPELEDDNICIPSMVIQPFVENAIWHGLLNKENGDCHLKISFLENDENLDEVICIIEDNGIGRDKSSELQSALKKHKSKGIQITRERLRRLSGNHEFDPIQIIDMKDAYGNALGTKVCLHLPIM
jgi:two-component system LytT family sensor kinase